MRMAFHNIIEHKFNLSRDRRAEVIVTKHYFTFPPVVFITEIYNAFILVHKIGY